MPLIQNGGTFDVVDKSNTQQCVTKDINECRITGTWGHDLVYFTFLVM